MAYVLKSSGRRIDANLIHAKLMRSYRIQNTTNDLDQACFDMRSFWPDARVQYSGKQPYYSDVNGLVLAHSSFSDNATVPGLAISGLRFEDCHLISIPLAGHSEHRFHGRTYAAGNNQAVFQPAGAEISAWPLSHVRTFQVTINRTAYQRQVQSYLGLEDVEKTTPTTEIALNSEFGRNIFKLSQRIVAWLNTPQFNLADAELQLKIYEQRFIQAVVEHQAQAWPLMECMPAAEPYYVSMAEEYMRYNHVDGMNLAFLSDLCGVSGRAIQLGFKKHRGQSPMEFSKMLRLESARQELLKADYLCNITQIALKCGFSHLGRFAKDYYKRFHELPSETIHKLK